MDFTFTEEQETIAKVARQLFEHRATPERLTELEAGDQRYDAALWRELATADLLGIALPENVGGSGHGFLELGAASRGGGRQRRAGAGVRDSASRCRHHRPVWRRPPAAEVPTRGHHRRPPAHRSVDRARAVIPDDTRYDRTAGRRRLAPRRQQGAGARRADRQHHAGPGRDGRMVSASSSSIRTPPVSMFDR